MFMTIFFETARGMLTVAKAVSVLCVVVMVWVPFGLCLPVGVSSHWPIRCPSELGRGVGVELVAGAGEFVHFGQAGDASLPLVAPLADHRDESIGLDEVAVVVRLGQSVPVETAVRLFIHTRE